MRSAWRVKTSKSIPLYLPNGKDDVGLPADFLHTAVSRHEIIGSKATYLKRDWPSELVQQTTSTDGQVGERHTLRSHLKRQDLDGVERLEWRESNTKDETENVDAGQCRLGCARVRIPRVFEDAAGRRHADPGQTTTNVGKEQKRSSAYSIGQ